MSTVTALPAGTWSLDPTHTHIGFTVRHMMVAKVRGSFSDFSAEITVAENPLEDPGTLQDPLLVVSNGRVALDRLNFGKK